MDTITTAAAALRYAAAALPVLPTHWPVGALCSCGRPDCESPGKHPLTRHGKDDATTDLDVVRAWWTWWPTANIGGRPPANTVVLDVDPRNGGDVALAALVEQHGALPDTMTAQSGSGGLHYWYRHVGPARGRLGVGLDVKTHSGYLILPPSTHVSARPYRWLTRVRIAPAPAWLARLLNPPPPSPARLVSTSTAASRPVLVGIVRIVLDAVPGERNGRLYWAGRRLFERVSAGQLTRDAAEGMLTDAATAVGLPAREAHATIISARKAALGG
ncbi:MAG: bifunctional DNA primase/polymerase [Pseudonocardiaceae bacterium]